MRSSSSTTGRKRLSFLLVPADPQDDRNAILEIRGGTGGDEAAIFAGDLFRMYSKYCESKGWKLEVSSANEGAAGGFKEIICSVTGDKVYGTLKYESGVHRVHVYRLLKLRDVFIHQPLL